MGGRVAGWWVSVVVALCLAVTTAQAAQAEFECEEKALLKGYVAANLSLERQLLALLEAGEQEQAKTLLKRSIDADQEQVARD